MMLALVLACCWVGIRIDKFGATTRRCIALAALSLLAMLTHYYASQGLLALAIYLLVRLEAAIATRVDEFLYRGGGLSDFVGADVFASAPLYRRISPGQPCRLTHTWAACCRA